MRFFNSGFIGCQSSWVLLSRIPRMKQNKRLFLFQNKAENPDTFKYAPKEFYEKLDLFEGVRPHGIQALRQFASDDGLFTVLPYARPKNLSLRKTHEFLCGTPVVYADEQYDIDIHPYVKSGVALHPGSPKSLFIWRGDVNPHLGHGVIHAMNKWEEYCLIDKYCPDLMPKLYLLSELNQSVLTEQNFNFEKVSTNLQNKTLSDDFNQSVVSYIDKIIRFLNKRFPEGVYLKHQLGCYTVDSGTRLLSTAIHAQSMVRQFLKAYKTVKDTEIPSIRQHLLNQENNTGLIVFEMLVEPSNVLVSPRIRLNKTIQGYPLEFRVDTIDCDPCAVWPRHPTTEYYPNEMMSALSLIRGMRDQLPIEYRYFSFGADVAIDEKGKPRLIEMNPGADSGFLKFGLHYNVFVSNLMGKETSLLKILNEVTNQSTKVQRNFLVGLSHTILGHPACDDVEDVALYMRNLQLNRWRAQNRRCGNANKILKDFRDIYTSDLSEHGIRVEEIIASTEQYFTRCGVDISMKHSPKLIF